MSWKVQALVGERVIGSITRKMVLLNMASRANDDGSGVYASLTMIAGWCEVDARTVRRVVRDLEADGLIVQCGWKEIKNGQINEWRVAVEMIESLPLYKDELAARRAARKTPDTVSGVKKRRKKSALYASDPGHNVRPDTESARTHDPGTPDTVSASTILEPIPLFEEASASSNRGVVVRLSPGEGMEAVAAYNEAAERVGWKRAKIINDKRKQAVRARLRECGGLAGWRDQIALAERQTFLAGDNDRGWCMDFDFFVRPSGWIAITEQKYLRGTPAGSNTGAVRERFGATPAYRGRRRSLSTEILMRYGSDDQPVDLGRVDSSAVK